MEKNTDELLQLLQSIQEPKELTTFMQAYIPTTGRGNIAGFLAEKALEKGLAKKQVVQASGIYRTYAYQILQGVRSPSRDKVLALCMAMQLGFAEVQQALLVAGFGPLHIQSRRDVVLIFCVNRQMGCAKANALLQSMGEKGLE